MRKILVLLFALIAMIGCQVVEVTPSFENTVDEVGSSIYYVGMDVDADTKTSLSGKEILWSEGDMMNIFFGANNDKKDKLVLMEGAGTISGSFYGPYIASSDISGDLHQTVIVYPYDENTTCVANENKNEYTIGLTIPSVQEYSGYSFANGAYPMVGVTENVREVFIKTKNVASIVRLNMKGTDAISRIIVSSDEFSLAGPAKVVASYESDPVATIVKETASNMVRLVCEEPVQLKEDEATPFSIAIAPGTGALKITVIDVNGGYKIYNVSSRKYARNGQIEFTISYKADQNILASIREAFANGGEYTLTADVFLTSPLTLPEGKSLTLDLNGYTISQKMECTESYSMITNYGSLTIQGEGKLSLEDLSNGGGSVWGSYTISNNGTLVVNNGVIEHLGTLDDDHDTSIPIQNYQGKVVINGGTISSPEFRSLRDFTAGGEIEINGGVFNGQVWMQGLGSGSSSLTIKGGEFSPCYGYDGSSVYVSNGSNVVNVEITGGTFNTKIGCVDANKEGVKGSITGGTFTESAKLNTNAALLKQGCIFIEENGVYNVVYSAEADALCNLQKAFEDGGEYTLTTSVALTSPLSLPEGKSLTLDLNGYTISQAQTQSEAYTMIYNKGTLVMKSSVPGGKLDYSDKTILTSSVNYVSNVVGNSGTLTIEEGVIVSNNSDATVSQYGYPHAIDNSGKLIVNGGTIENNSNYSSVRIWCTEDDDTDVTINGGTFNGCIDFQNVSKKANKGTLTINGGTFNSDTYTKSSVRLLGFGTDVDELNCYIKGGVFNGKIKLNNYVGGEFNSKVFSITGGTYQDLTSLEFLSNANVNVKLASNLVLDNPVTVTKGNTVMLDLNGYTVSQEKACTESYSMITNNGDLTVTGNGRISFKDTGAGDPGFGWGTYTIVNCGKMVVENGVIENISAMAGSHMFDAIDNHSGATLTINGGVVKCENYVAIRMFATSEVVDNVVKINEGAQVVGKFPVWPQNTTSGKNPMATLTINGATITGNVFLGSSDKFTLKADNTNFVVNTSSGVANAMELVNKGCTIQLASGQYDAITFAPRACDLEVGQSNRYARTIEGLTIKSMNNAEVNIGGLTTVVGHVHGAGTIAPNGDDVSSSGFYSTLDLKNITFDGLNFTKNVKFEYWYGIGSIDGVTFKNCKFDLGGIESNTGACIQFGAGGALQPKNVVVNNCMFSNAYQGLLVHQANGVTVMGSSFNNMGHNAIQTNGSLTTPISGTFTITGNNFMNGKDRAFRSDCVATGSVFVVIGNTFSNYCDDDGQVMKSTNITSGAIYNFSNNSYENTKMEDLSIFNATQVIWSKPASNN